MSKLHVICYHRVLPAVSADMGSVDYYHSRRDILHPLADFRRQLDLIRGRCDVLDAGAFLARKRAGGGDRPAVLLSFDDGYADFEQVVLPELAVRNLPCVLFPTKAPVVEGFVPPADRVYAILAAAHAKGRVSSIDAESWVSGSAKKEMLRASPVVQAAMIDRLFKATGITSAAVPPAHMTEERLRALPSSVYIGAHGLFHHLFGSLSSAQLKSELEEIVAWVRRLRPNQAAGMWLAYPNGEAGNMDNHQAVVDAVGLSGVDLAFTAHPTPADASSGGDLLIPRVFSKNGVEWLSAIID